MIHSQKYILRVFFYLLIIIITPVLSSCWPTSISMSDKGSMPEEWKSFSLKTLELSAPNAPNNFSSVLSENIKDGIQNNTRLLLNPKTGSGEVYIEGEVTAYGTSPIAIQQGDEAAKNRLSITANFTFFISKPKEEKWTLTSTQFIDFDPNTTDFNSTEISLYEEINKKIVQDVINKLFSNW